MSLDPLRPTNPYASPEVASDGEHIVLARRPMFATGVALVDLCFLALNVVGIIVAALLYFMLPQEKFFEFFSTRGLLFTLPILCLGFAGSFGMLLGSKVAVPCGHLIIAAVLIDVGQMLWMAVLEHSELPVEERHLAVIVLSLIVGLRFLWQIIYFFGLGSYAFWRKRTLLHNSPPELAHV